MPRNKVELKLIEDLKKRKVTFKNRSEGLVEKTKQIATLCGCDAFCISYDPTAAAGGVAVKTWPEDCGEVRKLIQKYRDTPADRFREVLTPLTLNEEELRKEQRRLLKVQQCGAGTLGPWDTSFDGASVADLNSLLGTLDETMQKVQQRMVALGLSQVHEDMTVLAASGAMVAAEPMPHAMLLPDNDNAFNFGSSSLPDNDSVVMATQHYDVIPHRHVLPQPFHYQPPCHGYHMPPQQVPCYGYHQMPAPPPYLSYQMPPPLPYFSYHQFPPTTTALGPPEFGGAAGYATNVINGASAAPQFYDDDLMQEFDAGGAYVGDDVLGQAAFSGVGPPSGAGSYLLAQHGTVGVWPVSTQNEDGAAFQFQLRSDFAGPPPGSASSSSFQGGFQN